MKKINNINSRLFYALIGILLFTSSCNDDVNSLEEETNSENSELPTFQEYLALHSRTTTEGSMLIEVSDNIITEGLSPTAYITERISRNVSNKNEQTKVILLNSEGEELEISSNLSKKENSKSEIMTLFGKTLEYKIINGNTESSKTSNSNSIDLPNLISINISTEDAQVGSLITWNVDSSNDHGVVIYATYSPTSQNDLTLAEQNLSVITRGIVLPDNVGSYTLTQSALERFPDNSYVDIVVMRGTTTTSSNKSPIVTAVSKATATLQINR